MVRNIIHKHPTVREIMGWGFFPAPWKVGNVFSLRNCHVMGLQFSTSYQFPVVAGSSHRFFTSPSANWRDNAWRHGLTLQPSLSRSGSRIGARNGGSRRGVPSPKTGPSPETGRVSFTFSDVRFRLSWCSFGSVLLWRISSAHFRALLASFAGRI